MNEQNKIHWMQQAIESAHQGMKAHIGTPFGACVVKENKIISIANNTVFKENDPTCHAEINAIRIAAKILGSADLSGCIMVATSEPCPMCLAAILWARMDKIIVGVDRNVAAQYGFDDGIIYQQISTPFENRTISYEKGILSKESEALFKEWQDLGQNLP